VNSGWRKFFSVTVEFHVTPALVVCHNFPALSASQPSLALMKEAEMKVAVVRLSVSNSFAIWANTLETVKQMIKIKTAMVVMTFDDPRGYKDFSLLLFFRRKVTKRIAISKPLRVEIAGLRTLD